MCTTWTFYLERYCGLLKREVKSRSQPWRNIDERLIHFARLSTLRAMYNLEDYLIFSKSSRTVAITNREHIYGDCEYHKFCFVVISNITTVY
jgi:hypothetical protein